MRIRLPKVRCCGASFVAAAICTLLPTIRISAQPHASVAGSASYPADSQCDAGRQWTVSVSWENDTFGGTDRYYTDGVCLGVSHTGPSWMDPVANWLPWGQGRRTVSYDVTQAMLTPADITRPVPDPNDRPYAGILAVGLTLHVEKENSYYGLKFVTGVVGPWSLAEETQDAVHDLIGADKSQGWDYQLENEPIFNFACEYRHRFYLAGERTRWSLQAFPLAGGWLGNMLIQGQAGGLLSFGYNTPDSFGPALVRGMGYMPPPRRDGQQRFRSDWGFTVFASSVANVVLRDITFDGNTFEDSPSVDKDYVVPMASIGVGVGNRRFQASFAYVFWGKEFEGQDEYSKFGSLTVSYFF